MSNRANYALALAAAGMLAVVTAPEAGAVTINPPSYTIDFGPVLIGSTSSGGVTFTIEPATAFFPNVFDLSLPFTYAPFKPSTCNAASCIVTFLFTPTAAGPVSQVARIVFGFDDENIERLVTLEGVGVVPVPGALPLFLTGLGGLAYMSRRRKPA